MTRRLGLLLNPATGRASHRRQAADVAERLSAAFDVTRLQGREPADAAEIARQVVDDGYDALVVMGGDGIVHLALSAVAGTATTLGVIAIGTGNDVARALGLPRRQPLEAADAILAGRTRTIDLGRVDGTYFATVLATGFDSLVNERANRMRRPSGQLRYTLATLAELRVFTPLHYRLELDGTPVEREAMLVAVGNAPSYGGGLRMCEGALLDDGLLDLVVIGPVTKRELVRVYPRLFTGSHVRHPAYERHRVTTATIAADGIVAYADGERIAPLPLTVEAAPGALSVFVR